MSLARTLINLLIVAVGPVVTFVYYASWFDDGIKPIFLVLILCAISAAVSIAVHLVLPHPLLGAFASIVISYMCFIVFLLAMTFSLPKGVKRAEGLMWLPVVMLLLTPVVLPTVCSVSYGTGRIVRDYRNSRNFRQNLPSILIGNNRQRPS